jgi:hypothetical protein
MDKIQNFIEENKSSFEQERLTQGHADRFAAKLNAQTSKKQPKVYRLKPLWIAAGLALLLGTSFFLGTQFNSELTPKKGLAQVSEEMGQTEFYYTSLIKVEMKKLDAYPDLESSEMVESALDQLEKLEKDYEELEISLAQAPENKNIVSAMINNFQLRVQVLNELLERINQVKEYEFSNENYNI